jgi:hypothetical protein
MRSLHLNTGDASSTPTGSTDVYSHHSVLCCPAYVEALQWTNLSVPFSCQLLLTEYVNFLILTETITCK